MGIIMKRFIKGLVVSTILVGATTLATTATAQTCIGTCGSLGANGDVTASPLGAAYQYVTTAGGAGGAGQIDGVGGTNGSEYLTPIFEAGDGDVLDFYFQYVTSDGAGYADYAFAELLDGMGDHVAYLFTARTTTSGDTSPGFDLPPNDSTLNPGSTPIIGGETTWAPLGEYSGLCFNDGCGRTGWIRSSYEILMGGNYQLRFGVTNWADNIWDSGLAFNGVTIGGNPIGVPEPAAWAMLIGGFGLAGGALRSRRTRIAYA
jgi:PEP-CTERM motif